MLMEDERTPAPAYIWELGGMLVWFVFDQPIVPFLKQKGTFPPCPWLYKFVAATVWPKSPSGDPIRGLNLLNSRFGSLCAEGVHFASGARTVGVLASRHSTDWDSSNREAGGVISLHRQLCLFWGQRPPTNLENVWSAESCRFARKRGGTRKIRVSSLLRLLAVGTCN
jgi:hypothetical protein